ncbi:type IV pilus assembly protein PilZ [Modicisalibacter ilicicola DSM 19980]|uniref:Type IV pilus assembly protein PilZ n=1 Tax=Modicisalibacter ilicicola DSM 19980 TaxID=1121942 RepID=A0A1M5CGR2_9GAMM|nr:PilZ domain-containing protein [Halomonas ilicicola]SHF53870.1 type IV pilus assembly protein PilZ [Halomonas ilicicola DSM 19980]
MSGKKALSLSIKNTQTLLSAYMPMLERGGIFVPTQERYTLGQEVFLLLTLPEESERLPVTGQVVWISPPGVSGRRMPGIGIHFSAEDQAVRDRIESQLAGQLNKGAPTYTL